MNKIDMTKAETIESGGTMFTTYPVINYDGYGLKDVCDMLREMYQKDGKDIIELRTYNDAGYDSLFWNGLKPGKGQFGIEVEWMY